MEKITEEMFKALQEQQKETYNKLYPDISVRYSNKDHVGKVPVKIEGKIYYTYEEYIFDQLFDDLSKVLIFLTIILFLI